VVTSCRRRYTILETLRFAMASDEQMTCRDLVNFLMEYLDGGLSAAERSRFEVHLAQCSWCVEYVRQYKETVRLGKAALPANDEPLPSDVPEELVQAILAARPK
jgi:anti-sigma factor RsiW